MKIWFYKVDLKVKIFDLTVKLYCRVKNLNFEISLNQPDKFIFFIKQRWSVLFSSIFEWNMSSDGQSLMTKPGVQVPKIANIGFFAHKPYLKGIGPYFLFDRKFCLVKILKRWKWLGVWRNAFFTILKNVRIIKTVKNGLKHCKWQKKLTKS